MWVAGAQSGPGVAGEEPRHRQNILSKIPKKIWMLYCIPSLRVLFHILQYLRACEGQQARVSETAVRHSAGAVLPQVSRGPVTATRGK